MSRFYGLDGHEPVPVSLMEWATQMELRQAAVELGGEDPWSLAYDELPSVNWRLSTIFLGLDQEVPFGPSHLHVPILFETILFGPPRPADTVHPVLLLTEQIHGQTRETFRPTIEQRRYATWDAAIEGHRAILSLLTEPSQT